MNKKNPQKFELPLQITKDQFVNMQNETMETKVESKKGRAQAITFTLNNLDIEVLEGQIDRSTSLAKRSKSKSSIIRMALRALENASDVDYIHLYNKF